MFVLIFNKDDYYFLNNNWLYVGEHLNNTKPNSDLQFIHKESGNSLRTVK